MPTRAEVRAALMVAVEVGRAIRELGSVPSGHLYASLMGTLSLSQYMAVIEALKKTGLVREEGHLLQWVPQSQEEHDRAGGRDFSGQAREWAQMEDGRHTGPDGE